MQQAQLFPYEPEFIEMGMMRGIVEPTLFYADWSRKFKKISIFMATWILQLRVD